ncbi:hypothetical protein FQN54_009169 [Arachnomyces sp. PD_36]|nr:hypothetical protein FQN54_009169 [Arachnomyces sp. PD_36]
MSDKSSKVSSGDYKNATVHKADFGIKADPKTLAQLTSSGQAAQAKRNEKGLTSLFGAVEKVRDSESKK